jgi:hypothetical protein
MPLTEQEKERLLDLWVHEYQLHHNVSAVGWGRIVAQFNTVVPHDPAWTQKELYRTVANIKRTYMDICERPGGTESSSWRWWNVLHPVLGKAAVPFVRRRIPPAMRQILRVTSPVYRPGPIHRGPAHGRGLNRPPTWPAPSQAQQVNSQL